MGHHGLRHFYHLYCGRPWKPIVSAHIAALRSSGVAWEVTAGIIGPAAERACVRALFAEHLPGVTFTEADAGYEQVTLRALRAWSQQAEPGEPVLYTHSKGVTHDKADGRDPLFAAVWRESMERHVVGAWQQCVELLGSYDAVGCHWLTPHAYPGMVTVPFFGGNFWWSTAGFCAALAPPIEGDRHEAELWLGHGDPRIFDLKPGWPTFAMFAVETAAILNPDSDVH